MEAGLCDGEGEHMPHIIFSLPESAFFETRITSKTLDAIPENFFKRYFRFVFRCYSSDVPRATTYFDNFLTF